MQSIMPVIAGALTAALLVTAACADTGRALYVAPDGDDAASGDMAAPLASLEGARDRIRTMKQEGGLPAGGVVVLVRGGVYERDRAFELSGEDSGTAEAPIVYRSHPGEEVRLVGGREVTGFEPVTDEAVLARLEESARGSVMQADLRAQGIEDFGQLSQRGFAEPVHVSHMELFFEDRPMTLARWPNEGYSTMIELPDGERARRFQYEGDRPARWVDEPDVWVYGYWYHDWADNYMKVEAIDTEARIITKESQHRYGLRKGHRWRALNVLAELDMPGEYYVDRESGILYFRPPGDIAQGRPTVSIVERLVVMTDVRHVTLRGFTLEACRGTAVTVSGGEHNAVAACTIRNIGNRAVSVSGTDSAVAGCDIYETGDGGISLGGGDRATLTPARLIAENNHIHHFSRWSQTYRPAVGVGGVGNIVRHNLIHHGTHNGIQLSGNEHLIELNEIHSVCLETGDVGAFYMGRDWTARGTVIRHNYWHNIRGPGRIGAMGVYLDDQASGITIFGNVFFDVTRAAFIGGGVDNTVENNIFVDCVPSVHIDARGLGWQKAATDAPDGTLRTRLRSMPIDGDLWRERYPTLPGILDDDPGTPKRNRVVRNISVGGRWDNIHAGTRHHQIIEDNLVDEDPHFVDPEGRDFRLRETSPAFELGFRPIPLERIGVYEDPWRASWPVEEFEPVDLEKLEVTAARQPTPPTTPPPVYVAPRSDRAVTVDGVLTAGEWDFGPEQTMILKEDFWGEEVARRSRASAHHDGEALYIAVDNDVAAEPGLKTAAVWGANDAVEISLQNLPAGENRPIIALRGYPNGVMEVADETGAPAAVIERAAQGVEYAGQVVGPTRWTTEWRIPFDALGIDPAQHRNLPFNIAVRKTADDMWLMWRSTRANTWYVDRAGVLRLGE